MNDALDELNLRVSDACDVDDPTSPFENAFPPADPQGDAGCSATTCATRLEQVLDLLKCWWWETDEDLRYSYFSGSIRPHAGLVPESLLGMTREEMSSFNTHTEQWRRHVEQLKNHEPFDPFEFDHVNRGQLQHFRTIGRPCFDDEGHFRGYRGVAFDVSSERRAEKRLARTKALLDQILENAPIAIAVRDAADGRHLFVNKAFETLFGRSRSDVLGRTLDEIHGSELSPYLAEMDEAVLAEGLNNTLQSTHSLELADGEHHLETTRIAVGGDEDGQPDLIIALIEDVTEEVASRQRITHLAQYDELTGLANRATFMEQLDQALTRQRRGLGNLAVILLDLDYFKEVNDTHGHAAGDTVLVEVAERLRAAVREVDVVARLGGDEFAIIQACSEVSADHTTALANRIIEAISRPIRIGESEAVVGISIGIAFAKEVTADKSELLRSADLALYGSKQNGRGCYRYFDQQMNAEATARRQFESELRDAIAAGAFDILYQPIVDAETRAIECLEATLHWHHPQRGRLSAAEFLDLAEEMNVGPDITAWLIAHAMRDAARWPSHIRLAINISPADLRAHSDLPDVIHATLSEHGFAPSRLDIEISEAVLIDQDGQPWRILQELQEIGVSIVLDDFGTGHSSLGLLRDFHFDRLKLDRSFVIDIEHNEVCAALSDALLGMAHRLGIATTADGVASEAQARALCAAGATTLQGGLFAQACPAAELNFTA